MLFVMLCVGEIFNQNTDKAEDIDAYTLSKSRLGSSYTGGRDIDGDDDGLYVQLVTVEEDSSVMIPTGSASHHLLENCCCFL